jgi:hypothetical protein
MLWIGEADELGQLNYQLPPAPAEHSAFHQFQHGAYRYEIRRPVDLASDLRNPS